MSKETLKHLIELVPEQDIETLYNVVIRFIPSDVPLSDEVEAIKQANDSIEKYGTISHNDIDWN